MSMVERDVGGKIETTRADSVPWWPPDPAAPYAPNVLMIVLDDVGFAQLGCFGSDIANPNIDRLAAEGLRYNNFHATTFCLPTRARLLTGRNHHAAGMASIAEHANGYPSSRGFVTKKAAMLQEMLAQHGYNSIATGKWHLVTADRPTVAGPFDHWPLIVKRVVLEVHDRGPVDDRVGAQPAATGQQ